MSSRFSCHSVADVYIVSCFGTFFHHDPAKLMSDNNRGSDSIIYVIMVHMEVRTTDATGFYVDLYLVRSRWLILYLAQFDKPITTRKFHNASHCFPSIVYRNLVCDARSLTGYPAPIHIEYLACDEVGRRRGKKEHRTE